MGNVRLLGVRNTSSSSQNIDFREFLRLLKENERRVKVDLHERPYWMEQGWTRRGNTYRGRYITRYAECEGEIKDRAGAFDVFIFCPPKELKRHRDWHCFNKVGRLSAKYKIHLTKQPKDVSSAILNIQRMIRESFRR
jgi:hypothetical protein